MFDVQKLWKERASRRSKDMGRYLRYIFNGHLVIVLFFMLGTAAYYYQQWVQTIPADFPAQTIMAIIFGLLLTYSPLYTFLLEADKVFLLPLESRLRPYFIRSGMVSLAFQSYLLLLLLAACMPLYAKISGEGFGSFLLFFFILLAIKGLNIAIGWKIQFYTEASAQLADKLVRLCLNTAFAYFLFKGASWIYLSVVTVIMVFMYLYFSKTANGKGLKWEALIDQEEKRMTSFYRIANLFTDVPKLKDRVKRRKWLDFFVKQMAYSQKKTYLHLFVLAFLRSGDYLGLFVRLTVIGGTVIYLLPFPYGGVAFTLLFLYLTGFQLLPLWNHYQNKIWLNLYPLQASHKKRDFQQLLMLSMLVQTVIFAILLVFKGDYLGAVAAGLAGSIFSYFFVFIYNNKRLFS